jgi:hypothetical protein
MKGRFGVEPVRKPKFTSERRLLPPTIAIAIAGASSAYNRERQDRAPEIQRIQVATGIGKKVG